MMYKWYTKQGKMRDSLHEIVYAIIYDSKKPSKKDVGKVEPFIKRNIIYVGESPLQNDEFYPDGLYLVYDDNSNRKQWLYFVNPTNKEGTTFANHMSFCFDKSDKNKACHFHSTKYDCNGIDDYTYRHVKDYFSDKLELPGDEVDILKQPFHRQQRTFILDLMKLPWLQVNGGGKRVVTNQKSKHEKHRPIKCTAFCDFWHNNSVKNMTAIGIRHNNTITFSISVFVKGRTVNNRLYKSFVFTCKAEDDYEQLLQEFMSSHILG